MKSFSDSNVTADDLDIAMASTEMKIKDAQRLLELQVSTASTNQARAVNKVEAELTSKIDEIVKENLKSTANHRVVHSSIDAKLKFMKRVCIAALILSGISIAVILHLLIVIGA